VKHLASIIIPCWNQLEFTRHCIAAVVRHTRAPWELIVVNNGSTDGTEDYLSGVQDAAPVPVTVIGNAENRGFPAAINQGLEAARGEYLVLLNNDVVVTDDWLDQLIALANAKADPDERAESVIGLVGPMSNYAAPPQLVEDVPYTDLKDMPAFARRWREQQRGKWLRVRKLSGFCLLMKRAVYDAVGGLDERFGMGFFDDDDLAERARQAGFSLAVARDLFVHHFGSRTFVGNGVDAEKLLNENAQRFADKWGLAVPDGRRVALRPWSSGPSFLADSQREFARQVDEGRHAGKDLPRMNEDCRGSERNSTNPTRQREMPAEAEPRCTAAPLAGASGWYRDGHRRSDSSGRLGAKTSLTMIVRDEEANLPHCLESARGLFDEIVVVDTGSIDRTKEIAREFGAKVFDFVWVDNFAAARNEALAHATGDYAFWLDADDVIDPPQRDKLRQLLGELSGEDEAAHVVRCACDPAPDGTGGATVVDHIRLFPLRDDVRWTYRVHEQILPALRRAKVPVRWTDLVVRHTGYTDSALRVRKLDRDTKILLRELEDRPDDPFVLFNLGSIAIERKDWTGALGFLKRSLAGSAPTDSITRKLFAQIARVHQVLGDSRQALQTCAEGLRLDAEDAELWFRKGVVHRHRGESTEAERCWTRILSLKRPDQFCSIDQGIYGHLTRRNLAALAAERGDHAGAERLWAEVLAECPGDREALAKLEQVRPVIVGL
jgi:glycosyltransferase involved in cell wall biosynthesis